MPNHVTNLLTITAATEGRVDEIKSLISGKSGDDEIMHIDFNKISLVPRHWISLVEVPQVMVLQFCSIVRVTKLRSVRSCNTNGVGVLLTTMI